MNPVETHRKNDVLIGENVQLINSHLDWNYGFLISVITNATILPRDASTHVFIGYSKIGGVTIENNIFIGYGSIILPRVTIGDSCIVGAGSVVTRDISNNSVAAGNPAHFICSTSDYISKHKKMMENNPVFNKI